MSRLLDTTSPVTLEALGDLVVEGTPEAGARAVSSLGAAKVGVWEITPGVSTDVEADEVFIVLAGSATVEIQAGETQTGEVLELAPGTAVRLYAGDRTVWRVHETLRKLYVMV